MNQALYAHMNNKRKMKKNVHEVYTEAKERSALSIQNGIAKKMGKKG
jgi:hypothetical protein